MVLPRFVRIVFSGFFVVLALEALVLSSDLTTAFTYQGRLLQNGQPADGQYDFLFKLYDAASGGTQVGASLAADDVSVSGGLFTVQLDFGDVFTGQRLWLEVAVRPGSSTGSYTILSPRQELTASPNALWSRGSWGLAGNSGTDPSSNWLGTSDSAAFEVRVNSIRAVRVEPGADENTPPNILMGYRENVVASGVNGAVISGGGYRQDASNLYNNKVYDDYGVVGGGSSNTAGSDDGNTTTQVYATVGGGRNNTASGSYAAVGGGYGNTASGGHAAVGGGEYNAASGVDSAVGGGYVNTSSGVFASVSGGLNNAASGVASAIGGGGSNAASGNYSAVGGGYYNSVSASYATVAGGGPSDTGNPSATGNHVYDDYGAICGGAGNTAGNDDGNATTQAYAAVGGGESNVASGKHSTVGGGKGNVASSNYAVVGGGYNNIAAADYATIAGGGPSNPSYPDSTNNRVYDNYGTIGGGGHNVAGDNDGDATAQPYATVGGGYSNTASREYATVGGGYSNTASNSNATVSGGYYNTASGYGSVIGGGNYNTASSNFATVSGGSSNTASGIHSTVPGGYGNDASGDYSFAAGFRARADSDGCFVWGDSSSNSYVYCGSTPNRTVFRSSGGFYIYTSSDLSTGAYLAANSGSWSSMSDRNAKDEIVPVDPEDVLDKLSQVPIYTWKYKTEPEGIRHMGPMAQDLYAAFGLGGNNKYISTIDADGIAMAAIEGLKLGFDDLRKENRKLRNENKKLSLEAQSLKDRVKRLEEENRKLKERLEKLEALVLGSSKGN